MLTVSDVAMDGLCFTLKKSLLGPIACYGLLNLISVSLNIGYSIGPFLIIYIRYRILCL